MLAAIRPYGVGIASSLALAAAALGWPSWPGLLGLEVAAPAPRGPVAPTCAGPADGCVACQARCRARAAIAGLLRSGEIDLLAAAACSRDIDRTPEGFEGRGWALEGGDSDGERHCRHVIRWSRTCLEGSMPRSELDALTARLEGQLAAQLRDRGRIELRQP
jgi:hypothetical protein